MVMRSTNRRYRDLVCDRSITMSIQKIITIIIVAGILIGGFIMVLNK